MSAKKKTPKTMQGVKIRVGQLLSRYLREIALEETEFAKDSDGDDRMVSKAEKLARMIWQRALGFEETEVTSEGEKEITHAPDKTMMHLIFDRMEGRAPVMSTDKKEKRSVADRVSEQGKKRINSISKKISEKE